MLKIITRSLLALSLTLVTQNILADTSDGCGAGQLVTKETTLLASGIRKSTNMTVWPSNWLSMTSGTSGCAKHKIVQKNQDGFRLVRSHFYALNSQIAKGDGEILTAYTSTFNCNNEAEALFRKSLRKNISKLIVKENKNAINYLVTTYDIVAQNPELIKGCNVII